MPREVFLKHHIAEITDNLPRQRQVKQRQRLIISDSSDDSSQELPFGPSPSKVPTTKANLSKPYTSPISRSHLRPQEIIEISSSSDEDIPATKPCIRESRTPTLSDFDNRRSKASTVIAPVGHSPSKARRRYIIDSSSEEESTPSKIALKPKDALLNKQTQKGRAIDKLAFPGRMDVRMTDDGIIEYIPTPKQPVLLTPQSKNKGKNTPITPNSKPSERRRTLLQPDPKDDLSWEFEQNEAGEVRSGAILLHRSGEPALTLQGPQDGDIGLTTPSKDPQTKPSSSPVKTPRRKKMPEPVAELHRLAIPFLKLLDSVVFGDKLGASHLPDPEAPAPPVGKGKRKDQAATIWGMGTRGDYNDGHDSFIELSWSNRMATTAGRTEYRKSAANQVTIKIELGVKVVTTRERLKSTLAHEACHAASWAISGDFKSPHGRTFKSWAAKVMKAFPDVDVTTKHDYEIDFKYTWKCLQPACGQIFKRHSNSIKIKEQGCHCGSKLQPQFTVPEKRSRVNVGDESPSKSAGLGTSVQRATPRLLEFNDEDDIFASIFPNNSYKASEGDPSESDSSVEELAIALGDATI